MDSGYESTLSNHLSKGKSKMESIDLDDLGYESTSLNHSPKRKSKMESIDLDDSVNESTSPSHSPKGKSKMESIGLDELGYESTLSNPSTKGESKMESIDLDDSGYESTSPNVSPNASPKRKSKMESIDFWFKKPSLEEKSISKCFMKTKNEIEYSVVETTEYKNPCKKKNGKYSASESFDDSNTSETSKSGKKLTNPNHYAMPKGYSPPAPDCLPAPPSSWLPEIELTNTESCNLESCEMSNGFESTTIPTTFDSLLLQPSFFTRTV